MFRATTLRGSVGRGRYLPVFQDLLTGSGLDSNPAWREDWDLDEFVRESKIHGVGALVAERLLERRAVLPADVAMALDSVLGMRQLFETLHRAELAAVFAGLAAARIPFIVLKGTALAYSVYRQPCLRARGDTDVIIDEQHKGAAFEVLSGLGFAPLDAPVRSYMSYQRSYKKTDRVGCTHTIDLHWRFNNRQLLALAFPVDELMLNSEPFPALGPDVRVLTPVFQLLHACVHRSVHLRSAYTVGDDEIRGDRLIWLYDIHLLVSRLGRADWDQFCEMAVGKGVCGLVTDALDACCEIFSSELDPAIRDRLQPAGRELSALLLTHGEVAHLAADFVAIPGWGPRLGLFREHFFPPAGFMLEKYQGRSRLWLPLLYVHRILRAAFRNLF